MNGATDIERIALQQERLQFEHFDFSTAWAVGTALRTLAESRGQCVSIDIEVNGLPLFFSAMPGTTPDNIDWIRRKKNVVALFRRSSYAVGLGLRGLDMAGLDFSARKNGFFPGLGPRPVSSTRLSTRSTFINPYQPFFQRKACCNAATLF